MDSRPRSSRGQALRGNDAVSCAHLPIPATLRPLRGAASRPSTCCAFVLSIRDPLMLKDDLLLPSHPGARVCWGQLYGSAAALHLVLAARQAKAPLLVIADDARSAARLENELRFFAGEGFP